MGRGGIDRHPGPHLRAVETGRGMLLGGGYVTVNVDVSVMDDWSLGRVCAVQRSAGMLRAAATPRHMQRYALAR